MKDFFKIFFYVMIPLLVLVSGGIIIYNNSYNNPEKTEKTIEYSPEEIVEHERIYESKLRKLKLYSVGDIVTQQELMNLECDEGRYAIWFDVHSKIGNSCLYEIKGLHNKNDDGSPSVMGWRFYIQTENNRIVSISKG